MNQQESKQTPPTGSANTFRMRGDNKHVANQNPYQNPCRFIRKEVYPLKTIQICTSQTDISQSQSPSQKQKKSKNSTSQNPHTKNENKQRSPLGGSSGNSSLEGGGVGEYWTPRAGVRHASNAKQRKPSQACCFPTSSAFQPLPSILVTPYIT